MLDLKPIASLSPTLLARKGGARPAMRPQLQPLQQYQTGHAQSLDDLGWNDMGYDEGEEPPRALAAWLRDVDPGSQAEPEPHAPVTFPAECEPLAIPENLARPPEPQPREPARRRRVAVSLKIDAHRHLQLRLASMLSNCSAQQLVIDALDRLLDELPGLGNMMQRLKRN